MCTPICLCAHLLKIFKKNRLCFNHLLVLGFYRKEMNSRSIQRVKPGLPTPGPAAFEAKSMNNWRTAISDSVPLLLRTVKHQQNPSQCSVQGISHAPLIIVLPICNRTTATVLWKAIYSTKKTLQRNEWNIFQLKQKKKAFFVFCTQDIGDRKGKLQRKQDCVCWRFLYPKTLSLDRCCAGKLCVQLWLFCVFICLHTKWTKTTRTLGNDEYHSCELRWNKQIKI